jgi:hypothetical protein
VSRGAFRLAVVLAALVAGARAARAADADDGPSRQPETSWYGWQVMATDGAAIGAAVLGYMVGEGQRPSASGTANVLYASSFALYALGGPMVHWAHGNGRKGLTSLGLRAGVPLGGALLGFAIGSAVCDSEDDLIPCPVGFAVMGTFTGMVAAAIVDAGGVAHEPAGPTRGPRLQAATFVPSGGGGTFLFTGRF